MEVGTRLWVGICSRQVSLVEVFGDWALVSDDEGRSYAVSLDDIDRVNVPVSQPVSFAD